MTQSSRVKVGFALLFGLFLCLAVARPETEPPDGGKVIRVYDGDTITIKAQDRQWTVRLSGIDAPERYYTGLMEDLETLEAFTPRHLALSNLRRVCASLERMAGRSRSRLKALAEDKRANLIYGKQKKDRYDRLVAVVRIQETDVAGVLLSEGLAIVDRDYPMFKTAKYKEMVKQAKKDKIGLWGEKTGKPHREHATCDE